MERNQIIAIMLTILLVAMPFATAAPTVDDVERAAAILAADANAAAGSASSLALGAYSQGATAGLAAYGTTMDASLDAYATGLKWGLATYGTAIKTATGEYGAVVDHALGGYGNAVDATGELNDAAITAASQGYGIGLDAALNAYSAGVSGAMGAYSATSSLTADAYALAVRETMIIYPQGVARFSDVMRNLGISTQVAYGLVFNPLALIDYLQGYDEFQGTITVRSPDPASIALRIARHPGSLLEGPPAGASSDNALASPFDRVPRAACSWENAGYASARAWSHDIDRAPESFDLGEKGTMSARAIQVSARPFGNSCYDESNVWFSTYSVRGEPHTMADVGDARSLDLYLSLTGSSFEARSPFNNRVLRHGYGFNSGFSEITAANMGVANPSLFVEESDGIVPLPESINHISLAGENLPEYNCTASCPILEAGDAIAWGLNGLASVVPKKLPFVGKALKAGAALVRATSYLAENWHVDSNLEGAPGGGISFDTEWAAVGDKTKEFFVKVPYEINTFGTFSTRAVFQMGWGGYWIEKGYRPTIGSGDCVQADACDWFTGKETTKATLWFWNEDVR